MSDYRARSIRAAVLLRENYLNSKEVVICAALGHAVTISLGTLIDCSPKNRGLNLGGDRHGAQLAFRSFQTILIKSKWEREEAIFNDCHFCVLIDTKSWDYYETMQL